jgi:hypothetical protein
MADRRDQLPRLATRRSGARSATKEAHITLMQKQDAAAQEHGPVSQPARAPAGTLILGAARIRAEAEAWSGQHPVAMDLKHADRIEARVREKLPERWAEIGAGGELVPNGAQQKPPAEYRSTVRKPDYVAAAASRDRLDLAQQAGALETALDMADTIEAANSLEQMLAHQLAVAHNSAMKLTSQLNRQIERMAVLADGPRHAANVEATRLAGAVSRMMTTFQQGALAMQRMRSGGRQVVTVQHVNVGPGGQAVVRGHVSAGGRGGNENER